MLGNAVARLWQLRRSVAAVAMIAFGAYQLYLQAVSHRVHVVTYAQFIAAPPTVGWYRITGVPLDYALAVTHATRIDPSDGVYVPAIDATKKITLLVVDETPPHARATAYAPQEIEGLIETFFEAQTQRDHDVAPLKDRLANDYRVLDKGYTPQLGFGLLLGVGGLVLGTLLLLGAIGAAAESARSRNPQASRKPRERTYESAPRR